jgi:NIMA (never in mitosis gene a)-related kinase 1/4/5
LLYT